MSGWQTARVFISSTFRDMHAERDYLVKVVFPRLRERLEKYRVHLVDIDLRWGITSKEADNDKVLDLCLSQIDECRPFFVGILGERYGWVPESFDEKVLSKYGWIQHATGKSVTELEILYGVLNKEEMKGHAFFYFRDPAFIDDVPDSIRPAMQAEDDESASKLRALKDAISRAGLPVAPMKKYPCTYDGLRINWRIARQELNEEDRAALEAVAADGLVDPEEYEGLDDHLREIVDKFGAVNLTDLEKFGERIYEQLWIGVKTDLKLGDEPPVDTETDALAEEQDYHERFMESRTRIYIGRQDIQDQLNTYADRGENIPCLVTGSAGTGKSAILAKFAATYAERHPDHLLIPHFVGTSPGSTSVRQMLRRFCLILKDRFSIEDEVPSDINELKDAFAGFLHRLPATARVVFVIDALNQLDETDNAQEMHWLPREMPQNVKMVLSCITDPDKTEPVLKAFKIRKNYQMDVQPLTPEERFEIVTRVPSLSAKTLDPQQIQMLLDNPATENPLFLLVALEELRGFGSFEQLNHRIQSFPREGDPVVGIFSQVIERIEDYFNAKDVRGILSLLAVARHGLSEHELFELIEGVGTKTSTSHLYSILRQIRPYLQFRGDLLDFYHRSFFKAARFMYLHSDDETRDAHTRLADYFEAQETTSRRADELPWQLVQAGETCNERLKNCITDLDMFMQLETDEKKYELIGYWLQLGDAYDMAIEYQHAVDKYELRQESGPEFADRLNAVAFFLNECARYEGAEPLYRRALEIDEQSFGANHPDVARDLNDLAELLRDTNRLDEAEPLYRRALGIDEQSFGANHPNVAIDLNNLAQLFQATNRLDEAEPLMRRALDIDEQSFGTIHPKVAIDLNNLAALLHATNRLDEAEPLMRRALDISEQSFGANHPEVTLKLNNLAQLLQDTNRLDEAEPLMRRALEISEQSFGTIHPNVAKCLNNLAALLKDTNRLDEAEPLMRRALDIDEQSFGTIHPKVAVRLNNLAQLFQATNRLDEAEPLMRRALDIDEQSFGVNHPKVAIDLNNLAALIHATHRLDEAEPLMRRALDIDEQSFGANHPKVAVRLNNLTHLLRATNRLDEAEPFSKRAVEITLRLTQNTGHEHPNLEAFFGNYVSLLQALGMDDTEMREHLNALLGEYGMSLA